MFVLSSRYTQKLISDPHPSPRNITDLDQSPSRHLHSEPRGPMHTLNRAFPTNLGGMLPLRTGYAAGERLGLAGRAPGQCDSGRLPTEVWLPTGAVSCGPSTSLRGPPHHGSGSCQMIGPHAINSSPRANHQNHSLFLCRAGRARMERPTEGQTVRGGWGRKSKAQRWGVSPPGM